MPKPARRLAALTAVLCVQAALATLYLLRVAPFNAPDEPAYLYSIDETACGRLPQRRLDAEPWSYEAGEPPLYAWLAAPLAAPLQDHALPGRVRALRFENLVFGLLATALVYLLCALVAGERAGIYAAAFCALLPQNIFVSATLGNDALGAAASAAVLWLGCRAAFRKGAGADEAAFCLAVALAPLAKASAAVPAACAVAACALRWRKDPRRLAARALAPAASALAACGWFYARNARVNGGPLGWPAPVPSPAWLHPLRSFFESSLARFGWMTSGLPATLYGLFAGALAAGLMAFAVWARRERPWRLEPAWLLVLASGGASCAFAVFEARARALPQGRLLLPALGPIALVLVTGWRYAAWQLSPSARRWLRRAGGAALVALHYCAYRAL